MRASAIGPDQLDSLRLAGPETGSIESEGFVVSEAVHNGSLLMVKVARFTEVADPWLWMQKHPTFLVEALRQKIGGSGSIP
ncbi:hypothetical protein ACFVGY_05435 [Streptomyces sp. NPDC127106]|uniref:hypothetical protein n=1 Tax=Streptomyces sp. NPDC127106 TaxID=3345360 RepID=UPI0036420CAE